MIRPFPPAGLRTDILLPKAPIGHGCIENFVYISHNINTAKRQDTEHRVARRRRVVASCYQPFTTSPVKRFSWGDTCDRVLLLMDLLSRIICDDAEWWAELKDNSWSYGHTELAYLWLLGKFTANCLCHFLR